MQTDFHFYCVAVLARAAGFTPDDALVLAYASQYVDDATEGDLIPITVNGGEFRFDPVRTCYDGLATVETLGWSGEKKVFIPFHYLPPEVFDPARSDDYTFITHRGSPFSRMLLDWVLKEPRKNHKRRLCRIGAALHTFADTWAHSYFSGRWHGDENAVDSIKIFNRSGKPIPSQIENRVYKLMPTVGHGEALFLPDIAYKIWGCERHSINLTVSKDNVDWYVECAREIYTWLRGLKVSRNTIPWKDIEPKIRSLFGASWKEPGRITRMILPLYYRYSVQDLAERCENWKTEFSGLFAGARRPYHYDKRIWRKEALRGNVEWDGYSKKKWARVAKASTFQARGNFWDSLWVHFHRAVLQQRNFVMERLP
ncbi:MAG TPA: hypothetical protein PKN50_05520 [Spirochaetota bacterium]|nr:hypothetical protein [Spirochaetota bacterium]HPV40400.1 hypothetical protein [Spirochaetota bacterium]